MFMVFLLSVYGTYFYKIISKLTKFLSMKVFAYAQLSIGPSGALSYNLKLFVDISLLILRSLL